jgi:membrane protein YdbS with pleckstrin-like domain
VAERTILEARRHGIVLVPPFAKAAAAAVGGAALTALGWPAVLAGSPLLAVAALVAVRGVWRWERTRIVVTTEQLAVVTGTLRRRRVAVALRRVGPVELEQSPFARLLDYGTLVAGELEVAHVPRAGRVHALVARGDSA